ncbi:hypothetical protein [Sphingobium sp.]|uniref:hypothetical protein n=1 Tax=Sphingobium sp. TaxID=1912891 RepID=UPI003BB4F243
MTDKRAVCDARHAFLCQVKALLAIHAENIVLLFSDVEMPRRDEQLCSCPLRCPRMKMDRDRHSQQSGHAVRWRHAREADIHPEAIR